MTLVFAKLCKRNKCLTTLSFYNYLMVLFLSIASLVYGNRYEDKNFRIHHVIDG